ncbi:MAG: ectoine hydroxylase-related dioxygenase (phytanoyl-CoA dioxygenase family) [Candidatus Latescibacterota bacterium]|jgi:ectoine hydroxylase-related dioxygenase (phytanoyl-CoA dioxygenase family)
MTAEEFEEHVLRMQLDGYTVLPNIFTEEECKEAQTQLEQLAADSDAPAMECLFNKAQIFERIYQVPELLRYVRYFLGEDAILSGAYGSIRHPDDGSGGLHSDGAITGHNRHQSMALADGGQRITSHVLGLNVIFCISDFTCENGATHVVPGSYKIPNIDVPQPPVHGLRQVEAKRGSVLVFNINTWHGPSANTSDSPRYALLTPWRRRWLRCEYDLAYIVKEDVLERAGEEGATIFGLSARIPYLEGRQWDRQTGEPKPEWAHLRR